MIRCIVQNDANRPRPVARCHRVSVVSDFIPTPILRLATAAQFQRVSCE